MNRSTMPQQLSNSKQISYISAFFRHAIFTASVSITLLSSLILFNTGCASSRSTNKTSWSDFVAPQSVSTNSMIMVEGKEYPVTQLISDFQVISNVVSEMIFLTDELSHLIWKLKTSDKKYITDTENKEAEYILFKFINATDALGSIMTFYRHASYPTKETHIDGASIAMIAGVNLSYYTSRFVALSVNNSKVIKILNAAHSKYEMPKGSYNKLFLAVTNIENISLMDTAWDMFNRELYTTDHQQQLTENSRYYQLHAADLQDKYFEAYIQVRYILFASGKIFPNIENRLRHSTVRSLEKKASNLTMESVGYLHGSVFKNVARIKNPTIHTLTFTDEQKKLIKSLSQPGDIILTYTAGYMSNVFLPGIFKHGITYIGTAEERETVGLTHKAIKKHTVSDQQYSAFKNNMKITEYPKGYEANIIEAVAEGVIINSLDYLLEAHINRLLILRPIISKQERIKQLATIYNYVGTPYDFSFNFSDDSHQCCTELIYRSLNNKGAIDCQLDRINGKWVLTADDLANYYLQDGKDKFDIILFADKPKNSSDNKAIIFSGNQSIAQLKKLMKVRPIDPVEK